MKNVVFDGYRCFRYTDGTESRSPMKVCGAGDLIQVESEGRYFVVRVTSCCPERDQPNNWAIFGSTEDQVAVAIFYQAASPMKVQILNKRAV